MNQKEATIQRIKIEITNALAAKQQIQGMVDTAGWRQFMAAFAPQVDSALKKAYESKDPYEVMKHMAASFVIKDLTTWADREIQAQDGRLSQLREELERVIHLP